MFKFLSFVVVFFIPTINFSKVFIFTRLYDKAVKKYGKIRIIGTISEFNPQNFINGMVFFWFNSSDNSTHIESFKSIYWYGYVLFLRILKLSRILKNRR